MISVNLDRFSQKGPYEYYSEHEVIIGYCCICGTAIKERHDFEITDELEYVCLDPDCLDAVADRI